MNRREIIAGLGSAVALPITAKAQQPPIPVIGYLSGQSADDEYTNITIPFLQGLKEAGYVDGQNVRSNTAGRKINMIGCLRSQPISSAAA